MKATYVSIWDDGQTIKTNCQYDPETKIVTEIESVDIDGLDDLIEEYVELPDGTQIDDFINPEQED